jgi:hypothetical protein
MVKREFAALGFLKEILEQNRHTICRLAVVYLLPGGKYLILNVTPIQRSLFHYISFLSLDIKLLKKWAIQVICQGRHKIKRRSSVNSGSAVGWQE